MGPRAVSGGARTDNGEAARAEIPAENIGVRGEMPSEAPAARGARREPALASSAAPPLGKSQSPALMRARRARSASRFLSRLITAGAPLCAA
jgi:hypothetical protein